MKLFSKNSNACDHNPPTWQTDGQTTYHGNTALRYASRGKMRPRHAHAVICCTQSQCIIVCSDDAVLYAGAPSTWLHSVCRWQPAIIWCFFFNSGLVPDKMYTPWPWCMPYLYLGWFRPASTHRYYSRSRFRSSGIWIMLRRRYIQLSGRHDIPCGPAISASSSSGTC